MLSIPISGRPSRKPVLFSDGDSGIESINQRILSSKKECFSEIESEVPVTTILFSRFWRADWKNLFITSIQCSTIKSSTNVGLSREFCLFCNAENSSFESGNKDVAGRSPKPLALMRFDSVVVPNHESYFVKIMESC